MRIVLVGDTHGNAKDIWTAARAAGDRKIQHILVLGDFGLWTHFADGQEFLDECNEAARVNNATIYAIGGNHENWDHWNWFVENMPSHKGFGMVRRRVLLAPKIHKWTWDNKQFVGAGGAVSIDKADRLINERGHQDLVTNKRRGGTGPKTLWWPNEELEDEHVETIKQWARRGSMAGGVDSVDYLMTHDCSNYTPFHGRLKPDADSERHRHRIDDVLRALKPKMHFHGHMHTKYDWVNAYPYGYSAFHNDEWTGPETQTYGLECNSDWNAWGVLDTELNEFAFRGAGMQFRSLES